MLCRLRPVYSILFIVSDAQSRPTTILRALKRSTIIRAAVSKFTVFFIDRLFVRKRIYQRPRQPLNDSGHSR